MRQRVYRLELPARDVSVDGGRAELRVAEHLLQSVVCTGEVKPSTTVSLDAS